MRYVAPALEASMDGRQERSSLEKIMLGLLVDALCACETVRSCHDLPPRSRTDLGGLQALKIVEKDLKFPAGAHISL